MKIVIDIPEEYYNAIKAIPDIQCTADMLIIKNGTPLPEHHGRLIDADAIDWFKGEDEEGNPCHILDKRDLNLEPTIIEGSDSE